MDKKETGNTPESDNEDLPIKEEALDKDSEFEAQPIDITTAGAPSLGPEIRWLGFIIFGFLGIALAWSLMASIDSAAIAQGTVAVASNAKRIQHQAGGTVAEVLVKEGDTVEAGDPLLQLDSTQSKASLELLLERKLILRLRKARLQAAQGRKKNIEFPSDLAALRQNPKVGMLMADEENFFTSQMQAHNSEIEMLERQITQLKEQFQQASAEREATEKQLTFLGEELDAVEILEKQQLVRKPRVLALRREDARLHAAVFRQGSEERRLAERQAEVRARLQNSIGRFNTQIFSELEEANRELLEGEQRLIAAIDVHKHMMILAPADGVVQGLRYHTKGEVVRAGEPIMNLIPVADQLIIRAHVSPLDIDMVHVGLKAKIQLSALSSRDTPTIWGTVEALSPDVFTEENGTSYYMARIIAEDEVWKQYRNQVSPGMPVQVMIISDNRSPFSYFITPLRNSLQRAFKEK